jgi:hypothetical protein
MATVLLTDQGNPEYVSSERVNARIRLSAYLHGSRLDRELAAGACPDSSAALSLRAQALLGASARSRLASYIERLVEEAPRPLIQLTSGAPVRRRQVLAARRTLLELAERLVSSGPIDARGVAYAGVLVSAADGPVYDSRAADDFEPALRAAITALDPEAWTGRAID